MWLSNKKPTTKKKSTNEALLSQAAKSTATVTGLIFELLVDVDRRIEVIERQRYLASILPKHAYIAAEYNP
jgi:hypothetical protein